MGVGVAIANGPPRGTGVAVAARGTGRTIRGVAGSAGIAAGFFRTERGAMIR